MKKAPFVMLAVPVLAGMLAAEPVMVQLVSGDVQVKDSAKGSWEKVQMKMKLDDSAVIKVAKNSRVQLVTKTGSVINLSGETTAKVSDLFASSSSSPMMNKLKSIQSKLGRDGNDSFSATAVAGVRGADVYEQNQQLLKKELYWEE